MSSKSAGVGLATAASRHRAAAHPGPTVRAAAARREPHAAPFADPQQPTAPRSHAHVIASRICWSKIGLPPARVSIATTHTPPSDAFHNSRTCTLPLRRLSRSRNAVNVLAVMAREGGGWKPTKPRSRCAVCHQGKDTHLAGQKPNGHCGFAALESQPIARPQRAAHLRPRSRGRDVRRRYVAGEPCCSRRSPVRRAGNCSHDLIGRRSRGRVTVRIAASSSRPMSSRCRTRWYASRTISSTGRLSAACSCAARSA